MVGVLYSTEVRVSELVALNVGDIEDGENRGADCIWKKAAKERTTYLTDGADFILRRYLKDTGANSD